MPTIEEKVHSIIGEVLEIKESSISSEKAFVEDLGADQLDVIEIVMTIEDTMGISLSQDDISHIATVGQLVEFVRHRSDCEDEP